MPKHFRLLRALLPLFAAAFCAVAAAPACAQIDTGNGPLPVFEFHSGFWLNLHHTLYYAGRQQFLAAQGNVNASATPPLLAGLPEQELRPWKEAVAYYAANFAAKDLLFATDLIQLKDQLGDFEDCSDLSGTKQKFCNAGLDPKFTKLLEAAAPVYRAHLWSAHDKANRRWVFGVAPLVRSQSVGLSQRLADIYQTHWPRYRIRVDMAAYANWAGAYTTVDPLRVTISSTDPGNQGNVALEVLFHEASHGIAEPVEQAIIRECRQRDKAIPRDLWHALVFYTTGEVIRPIMARAQAAAAAGPTAAQAASSDGQPRLSMGNSETAAPASSYKPYAMREGLYQRGWQRYLELLVTFWQPYLDSSETFDDAIARMVSSL